MAGFIARRRVQDRYQVTGFISSGTYGRVYKAKGINGASGDFAIKKCVAPSPTPATRTSRLHMTRKLMHES